jgi:hypothetical protein
MVSNTRNRPGLAVQARGIGRHSESHFASDSHSPRLIQFSASSLRAPLRHASDTPALRKNLWRPSVVTFPVGESVRVFLVCFAAKTIESFSSTDALSATVCRGVSHAWTLRRCEKSRSATGRAEPLLRRQGQCRRLPALSRKNVFDPRSFQTPTASVKKQATPMLPAGRPFSHVAFAGFLWHEMITGKQSQWSRWLALPAKAVLRTNKRLEFAR